MGGVRNEPGSGDNRNGLLLAAVLLAVLIQYDTPMVASINSGEYNCGSDGRGKKHASGYGAGLVYIGILPTDETHKLVTMSTYINAQHVCTSGEGGGSVYLRQIPCLLPAGVPPGASRICPNPCQVALVTKVSMLSVGDKWAGEGCSQGNMLGCTPVVYSIQFEY